MVGAVAWIVSRGLLPLRFVTTEVQRRDVSSLAPLGTKDLPLEIAPLVSELNRLLARLQRAFSTQRAFIADAAHELRSPLTALRLQLQLLDRAPDEAARLEARGRLGAAVERAIHLVEQLLTLARSEPQETPPTSNWWTCPLPRPTGHQDTHDLAAGETHRLGTRRRRATAHSRATPRRFARWCAISSTTRCAIRRRMGRSRCECARPRRRLLLEVIDTGPGIAPADRERVFDRFYRRAAAQESGTGLGLAIVKAIAERHGAAIHAGRGGRRRPACDREFPDAS